MRQSVLASASDAPHLARAGTQVTITLEPDKVLSGVVTDQLSTGKMGIVLDGRYYLGWVAFFSRDCYRLLINDRIIVKRITEVRLIAIQS